MFEQASANMQAAISAPQSTQSTEQSTSNNGQSQHVPHGTNQGDAHTQQSFQIDDDASAQADQKAIEDIFDLETAQKIKFQGREWTPEELQQAIMRQQDYTKKTQALAKERNEFSRYTSNLRADLAKVKADPTLAQEFRNIYPEAFHQYLDIVLEQAEGNVPDNQQDQTELSPAVAREIAELKKKLGSYDQHFKTLEQKEYQAAAKEHEAHLNQLLPTLEAKYQFASEPEVLTKAEMLIAQGYQMNDATWERLYKESNAKNQGKYEKLYQEKVKKQINANHDGSDMGRGGGTPTPGRKKMSLDQVADHMIGQLTRG